MDLCTWIEVNEGQFVGLSDQIWEFAELGLQEKHSSDLLASALAEVGFDIRREIAGIPTAFVASYGTDRPIIAILGEYDALPDLSQERVSCRKPREEGRPGHGCGHNLIGVGALAATMAIQAAIKAGDAKGTIRFYGCPAEEIGAGKTFMVKAGAFSDVDLSLTWHPGSYNGTVGLSNLANIKVSFLFRGRSAHAAADPFNGRSALDAVELMNVGTNYLREHVIPEARIHYIIVEGGSAPNVVPHKAESLYLIRAPLMHQVQEIYQRVVDVARGAALMTGTEVEVVFRQGRSNFLLNDTVNAVLHEKMVEVGPPEYTEEEIEFGEQIEKTCPPSDVVSTVTRIFGTEASNLVSPDAVFLSSVMPNTKTGYIYPISTDVGDVSWVTPTGQITATTTTARTPGHSWQMVAQSGVSIGHKGMLYAAKVMALTAQEFLIGPERLQAATAEFEKKIKEQPYVCPLPDGIEPLIGLAP